MQDKGSGRLTGTWAKLRGRVVGTDQRVPCY